MSRIGGRLPAFDVFTVIIEYVDIILAITFFVTGVGNFLVRVGSRSLTHIGGRLPACTFRVFTVGIEYIDIIFGGSLLVNGVTIIFGRRTGSQTMSRIGGRLGDGNTHFTASSSRGVFLLIKRCGILSCPFLWERESLAAPTAASR